MSRKPICQTLKPFQLQHLYRSQQLNRSIFFQYRHFSSVVPPPKNDEEEELAGPNFASQPEDIEAQNMNIEEQVAANSVNLDDINLYESFKEANELDNEDNEHDNRVKEISLKLMEAKEPE